MADAWAKKNLAIGTRNHSVLLANDEHKWVKILGVYSGSLDMQEREINVRPRQEIPYIEVSSEEFAESFSALHISEQPRLPVRIHQSQRDSTGLSHELQLQHWLLSPTGPKLETALVEQIKAGATEICVGVALHGYACAGMPGKKHKNYWSPVTAALNCSRLPHPVLAFDLPSYNATLQDKKTISKNPWLKKIDHYPYVFLQAIDNQLDQIEEALLELPAVSREGKPTQELPLNLEVMAHSVGGRAVMVAASLDNGNRLVELINRWQLRLGRTLHLSLTILEPAFGLQADLLIQAVNMLNNPATRLLMKVNPWAVILSLRGLLSPLRGRYHLSKHDELYPLQRILQTDHLEQIISHPRDIAQLPEVPLLTPGQLTRQGIPTQVIMSTLDSLVDNAATGRAFKFPPHSSHPVAWPAVNAHFNADTVSLTPNDAAIPEAQGTIFLHGAGHTAELDVPGVIAALVTHHVNRSQP